MKTKVYKCVKNFYFENDTTGDSESIVKNSIWFAYFGEDANNPDDDYTRDDAEIRLELGDESQWVGLHIKDLKDNFIEIYDKQYQCITSFYFQNYDSNKIEIVKEKSIWILNTELNCGINKIHLDSKDEMIYVEIDKDGLSVFFRKL